MENAARRAALEAMERCRRGGAWSASALDAVQKQYGLERRDASLCMRLCLGVLQNSAYCDYYIGLYGTRRPESLQPQLRDILRLGVFQLLFLDKIPARAAVNESVALCRSVGLERAAGLVNAVLRRVAENRDSLPPIPGEGTAAWLSRRYSHPLWMAERLLREHDYAFTEAFFRKNNEIPGLTIQVNTARVSPEDYTRALERAGIRWREWPELPGCLELEGGSVTALPGYEEGLFYVQDRAARSAVAAAGAAGGMRVLDACAAPGGKSFAAALAMEDRGSILSCDIHEKKLRLIENGAERLGLTCIRIQAHDAREEVPSWRGGFDLAIADVPCSGLGVIRKRPEIREKKESEIAGLPTIQSAILQNLSACVRQGGTLLYSTCTVLRAENDEVVDGFLRRNPGFEPVDFCIGAVRSQNGRYTFWPQTDGTDGFFAAKLRRKE